MMFKGRILILLLISFFIFPLAHGQSVLSDSDPALDTNPADDQPEFLSCGTSPCGYDGLPQEATGGIDAPVIDFPSNPDGFLTPQSVAAGLEVFVEFPLSAPSEI